MDKIQELNFLQENIPNMKVEYLDIILNSAEAAYFKDDSGLGYSAIIGFILDALNNQKTSIAAINEIGHWDLLEDVISDVPYNMTNKMEEILREKYNIAIYEDELIPNSIADLDDVNVPCIIIDEENNIVYAISVDGEKLIKEEFKCIDEAIAFLTIDNKELDLMEAKLIEKTDNKLLEKKLMENNYFGLKEEKAKMINEINALSDKLGSFIELGNKNLDTLSETSLELISMQLNEIEKLKKVIQVDTTEKIKETIDYDI